MGRPLSVFCMPGGVFWCVALRGGRGIDGAERGRGEQMTIRSFRHEQQRGTEGVWERHRFKLRQVGESTVPWGQPCRFYG